MRTCWPGAVRAANWVAVRGGEVGTRQFVESRRASLSERKGFARVAHILERAVVALAAFGVLFHTAIYAQLPRPAGAHYGSGDIAEFALLLSLFLLACACAVSGVALAYTRTRDDLGPPYRAMLIGLTTFVTYYLLLPSIPRLG